MADSTEPSADPSEQSDGHEPPSDRAQSKANELDEGRMPFTSHLFALRTMVRNSVLWLIGGFAIAFTFKQELLVVMLRPLLEAWQNHPDLPPLSLYFGSLLDPFWGYFSLALWAGIFVSSPFIFYELWKFIAPGLYKRERRLGVGFAFFSGIFFVGGAVFCYLLVLPAVIDFLIGFSTNNLGEIHHEFGLQHTMNAQVGLQPILTIREYIGITRKLLIGFGLVFELPLFIFFLSLIGLVTHRKLWKFNRWWIVLSFVISAALTPPDVMSQILMAGPLVVLYNLSIVISWIVTRRRERKQAAAEQ